jgi:hypothetical protein
MTTEIHLVMRLRMRRAMLLLPHTSSWHRVSFAFILRLRPGSVHQFTLHFVAFHFVFIASAQSECRCSGMLLKYREKFII